MINSHENWMINHIARNEQKGQTPIINEAWRKISKEIFKKSAYAALMEEFVDVYGYEVVQNDMRKVKELQKKFILNPELTQLKRMSNVLEGIISIHAEMSNWLGEEAMVLKASFYDDYFNGVDLYSQWGNGLGRSVAFSADVTFSKRPETISRKLDKIKQNILNGRLTMIKYYKSPCGDFKGKRDNVPHAVLATDAEVVTQLASLYLANRKQILAEHPIQMDILDQLAYQFRKMHEFAKVSKTPADILEIIKQTSIFINKLFVERLHAYPYRYTPSEATERLKNEVDNTFGRF